VLELLEESRRGMEENTRQGFNTGGVAPYGYRKVLAITKSAVSRSRKVQSSLRS